MADLLAYIIIATALITLIDGGACFGGGSKRSRGSSCRSRRGRGYGGYDDF